MTAYPAEKVAADRWSGPEWFRHIAGRPLADRRARRGPLSWKDELALLNEFLTRMLTNGARDAEQE